MSYKHIVSSILNGTGYVQLSRFRAFNAINNEMASEILNCLRSFDSDGSVKSIIIKGNEKAFAGIPIFLMSSWS